MTPAIFVPFPGVDASQARPKDRDEKLKRILADLDKHHDAVRRNMIYLVGVQKEKLLSDAREAMRNEEQLEQTQSLDEGEDQGLLDDPQDVEDLLESLRVPARKDTDGKEYEYEDGDFNSPSGRASGKGVDAEGDAAMGGMSNSKPAPATIRGELTRALQELVTRTAADMEDYDRHAENTKNYYQAALQRSAARKASELDPEPSSRMNATDTTGRQTGGILKNRNEAIMVDKEALGRIRREEHNYAPVNAPTGPRRVQGEPTREGRRTSVDASRDLRRCSFEATSSFYRR